MVQTGPVSDPAFVTEDGEERPIEWPFNFVKNVNQAAQLAAYKLFDARELHPIELVCLPRLRAYLPTTGTAQRQRNEFKATETLNNGGEIELPAISAGRS